MYALLYVYERAGVKFCEKKPIYIVHTNLFSNSFFPSTVRAWNDLPNDIKNAPSVGSFKYKINKSLRSPPKFYNAGTRKGQILQARLRLECSSLKPQLHCHDFGHDEATTHHDLSNRDASA